jgi:hypothetical protein
MLTQADRENYGDDFLDMTRRAAADAVRPELQRLHAENAQLRQMAARSQNASIEQALDRGAPGWRDIYHDPRFAEWLAELDPYAAAPRSQLMRNAVSVGDANRVVRFYQGFLQKAGHSAGHQRAHQSRPAATGGRPLYSRDDIKRLYEQRRKGEISDSRWAQIEPDIFAAGAAGRIAGALSLVDGTELTRLTR